MDSCNKNGQFSNTMEHILGVIKLSLHTVANQETVNCFSISVYILSVNLRVCSPIVTTVIEILLQVMQDSPMLPQVTYCTLGLFNKSNIYPRSSAENSLCKVFL